LRSSREGRGFHKGRSAISRQLGSLRQSRSVEVDGRRPQRRPSSDSHGPAIAQRIVAGQLDRLVSSSVSSFPPPAVRLFDELLWSLCYSFGFGFVFAQWPRGDPRINLRFDPRGFSTDNPRRRKFAASHHGPKRRKAEAHAVQDFRLADETRSRWIFSRLFCFLRGGFHFKSSHVFARSVIILKIKSIEFESG
jgi:hypothetical protein